VLAKKLLFEQYSVANFNKNHQTLPENIFPCNDGVLADYFTFARWLAASSPLAKEMA